MFKWKCDYKVLVQIFPIYNSSVQFQLCIQFLGMPSNVWMKWCGHSSGGTGIHWVMHMTICSLGCHIPSYFYIYLFSCSAQNMIRSNSLHWYKSLIFSLWVPHQRAGVDFKEISKTNKLWHSKTSNSKFVKNSSKSFRT